MVQLKERFRKNGLDYQLIKRNDLVALYELLFDGECVGWEVARIHIEKPTKFNGFQEREALPSNEQFGTEGKLTKSQAFHCNSRMRAEAYFTELLVIFGLQCYPTYYTGRLKMQDLPKCYAKETLSHPEKYQSTTSLPTTRTTPLTA